MLASEIRNLNLRDISRERFTIKEHYRESLHIVFKKDLAPSEIAKATIEIMHLAGGVKDYGVQLTDNGVLEIWINPCNRIV